MAILGATESKETPPIGSAAVSNVPRKIFLSVSPSASFMVRPASRLPNQPKGMQATKFVSNPGKAWDYG